MDRVSRSRLLRVSLTTAAALLLSAAAAAPLTAQTAREIIDKVDRMMRGESSHGRMTVDITTEHWSRSLDMEVWSLGAEHSLVRVESPAREAGTATLFAGDEVWNYLPRVDRTIKVPPALMMGSWMGSHLTNDDIVKESRIVDDYDFEISFEGEVDGVEVYEFTMTPRPEAPVVWGRVEEQVRKHDLMPTWVRYYDDDGTLVRTMTFSDYKMMSGRLVPAVFHIIPADKPEEKTSMTYHELEFDIDLDESFFSLRTLRARR
ncbi:MAG TPA: outer membrane lipoprotein-sorting protein [Gemmatimonadetes bacterium]|nr:outer membrane lipoprotein-sorting protein [Gemmatimonadota bacterium]